MKSLSIVNLKKLIYYLSGDFFAILLPPAKSRRWRGYRWILRPVFTVCSVPTVRGNLL